MANDRIKGIIKDKNQTHDLNFASKDKSYI